MIHVSTAEKNFAENTFFVSTFLDKYNQFFPFHRAVSKSFLQSRPE